MCTTSKLAPFSFLQGISPKDKNNDLKYVEYDLRRIGQNSYQIVIIDQTDNIENAQKAAEKISQALMFKYQSYGFYFWTEYSGTSPPSALKK